MQVGEVTVPVLDGCVYLPDTILHILHLIP